MKDKIMSISFCAFIFGFLLLNILFKDNNISKTERRYLSTFPSLDFNNILSGKWMDEFDSYALDQFIFRDEFRSLKANVQINLFRKLDNNGIFIKNGGIYKVEYPLDVRKVNSFVYKINTIYDDYLAGMNVYYTIIPDKNYYLDSNNLKMDYDELFNIVTTGINSDIKYIDIRDCLSLDDYYLTDTHWKQNKIDRVVSKLGSSMNLNLNSSYIEKTYYPFYGVYYGQAALKVKADTINYLTNEYIDDAIVIIDDKKVPVYRDDLLGKMDSYDLFLSGPVPFIEIENKKNDSGKELIIFRDSFASTLAPLLIEQYSKITLVDLRYMNPADLKEKIQFKNQDVLIIHNTLVINNSEAIRI